MRIITARIERGRGRIQSEESDRNEKVEDQMISYRNLDIKNYF